jgi:hypothetical protein
LSDTFEWRRKESQLTELLGGCDRFVAFSWRLLVTCL